MSDMTIYDGIHPTLQGELQSQATEVRSLIRKTSDDLYRIGEILASVKETLQNRNFSKWCELEVGIKKSSAYKYLSIYDRFSEKKGIVGNIDPGVLMDMGVKSTPQVVVDKVVEKAEAGEQVSASDAKEFIAEVKEREKQIITAAEPPRPKDMLGTDIPESLEERFKSDNRMSAIKKLTAAIQEHTLLIEQGASGVEMMYEQIRDRARWIFDEVDHHHPVFVCQTCGGGGWDDFIKRCRPCKGKGWIRSTSS